MFILIWQDIGIFRKIPLKNSITRLDGTKSSNRAKISDISVSENYTTSTESGYKVIKIGSSNKTVNGRHSYIIKYTYNIGKDPLKNADELYYNLIGDEWDTNISNVTFKITMPKSFDESLLGFSSGYRGSSNSSNISYTVNENVITGSVNNTLNEREGLTVRLTLPEGYFANAKTNVDMYSIAVIIFSLACVLIADRLWAKYGKDKEVIETVEFYPPEGYNSAEVGFLYNGEADTKGVISLLIYLANKGYLKIEETEQNGLFSTFKSFKITKLKEYDGNNENEKIFFNGLFKNTNNINMAKVKEVMELAEQNGLFLPSKGFKNINMTKVKEMIELAKQNDEKLNLSQATESETDTSEKMSVTANDLYNSFYKTLDRIKNNMNRKESKNKIFESSASGKRKWLIIMIILTFILITIKPFTEYYGTDMLQLLFALLFPGIGFSFIFSKVFGKDPIFVKIIEVIWGLGFSGAFWATIMLPALIDNTIYLITYIIGIICVAIIILFMKIMPKRTPFGTEMLGKLSGFKRFLETAEKPQLEALVMKNPEYFYNILPYTYALGVSDVWMKQFETIAMQAPDWYVGYSTFSMHSFNHFMNNTMESAQIAMSSSPSSSGGGGSSGGGSSGGGSSGGGSGGGGRRSLVKELP